MQHVFSTTTSAASRSSVGSMPSATSNPAIRSESCSFIWQPYVRTKNRPFTADSVRVACSPPAAELPSLSTTPRSRAASAVDLDVLGWVEGDVDLDLGVGVDTDRGPDLLADLDHQVDVLGEERLHVLPALAELLTLVGEPRSRLLDDAELHTDVEQRA